MSNAPNSEIFKNVTNVTDSQASELIKAINYYGANTLIGSAYSLRDVSLSEENPEFNLAKQIKPSAIRLASLQSEYNVVMTMYQNAHQDYKKFISDRALAALEIDSTADTPSEKPAQTHIKINNTRYSDSVGSTSTVANVVDAEDCYSSCTLPQCKGATFNSDTKTCDFYGSVGSIYSTEDIKFKSIIPAKEFPVIVLQMLSVKLDQLHEAIKQQNSYLNILPKEETVLTQNGLALTTALIDKNNTDKQIQDITNSLEKELKDSHMFVKNKYSIYTFLNAIVMILLAIYAWNFTVSIITLVLIIMLIAINTSIFSGIILFLYILFYFYFNMDNS